MNGWVGVAAAATTTLVAGLWVALAWELRERAARTLALAPGVFSQPELAYGPFWIALGRAALLTVRRPGVFVPLSVFALIIVLSGRSPTSLVTDDELREQEVRALARLRQALGEDEDG